MKGRTAALCGLVVVVVTLPAAGVGVTASDTVATDVPLYGVMHSSNRLDRTTQLVRVDPNTLSPLGGRRLRLANLYFLARSPDGRLAVFGRFPEARLWIVDLAAARIRSTIRLGVGTGWRTNQVSWPTADRVIALVQRNRGAYHQIVDARKIVLVDPLAGRVVARRAFPLVNGIRQAQTAGDKLVLLLGRGGSSGHPIDLAVVDSGGHTHSVRLALGPTKGRFFPALVLEPSGDRAFVVAAGLPVAEIDLATLTVTSHAVTGGGALFAAHPFASRGAFWVGNGKLAVSGVNVEHVGRRRRLEVTHPLGVALVDTTTWQAQLINSTAPYVSVANGTILAFGARVDFVGGHQRPVGVGLTAYDAAGKRLWSKFDGKNLYTQPVRDRALVAEAPWPPLRELGPTHVLALSNGREIRTLPRGEQVYVLPDAPTATRKLDSSTTSGDPPVRVQGDGASFTATVRSDVTRLAAVLVDGSERTLPLSDSGRVTYEALVPAEGARLLQAYVGDQLVSSVSLAVHCGGAQGPCAAQTAAQADPEYAFFAELPPGATTLSRINPRTLLPVGRRLAIRPGFEPSYGRSPDGRYVAVADRDRPSLRVIDLRELRVVRTVDLGGNPASTARVVAWLSRDRVAVLTQRFSEPTRRYVRDRAIVFADPLRGRVLRRRAITNKLALNGAHVDGGRMVVLLRSSEGKGSTNTLVVASADGSVRVARIEVGRRPGGALQWTGFALDPSGRRAFIFRPAVEQDTQPVIEVDLDTMHAASHPLDVLDSQLEPPTGGFSLGPVASPFGDHTVLAMTVVAATTKTHGETYPAGGVFAIDTESWAARRVASEATYFRTRGDRLVTYGFGRVGLGVTVYDDAGKALQHLYDGRRFNNVQLAGGYGHVLLGPPRTKRLVFDLRTGKPLGMLPRLKRYLVVLDPPPRASPARRPSGAAGGTGDDAYTFSERGKAVKIRLPSRLFYRHRAVGRLVGTAEGRAFYKIMVVGVRLTCFSVGRVRDLGQISALSCPGRLGDRPLVDFNAVEVTPGSPAEYLKLEGFAADQVATVAARDADGNTLATVTPAHNIYVFPQPLPEGVARVVALDGDGNELKPRSGTPQDFPEFLHGPRATKVRPTALKNPIQHGENRGVVVTVGANGVVVFDATRADRYVRRLAGRRWIGFACFKLSAATRDPTYVSSSARLGAKVAVRVGGIAVPLTGCEVQGSYGHRWRDQYGTHSLVEVALTERGRRYYADRAAARDLALFVRSPKTQRIRRQTGEQLRADLRREYGLRIVPLRRAGESPPVGEVGYWIRGDRTIFAERSTTGVRFFVELIHGRIKRDNVGSLAGVF